MIIKREHPNPLAIGREDSNYLRGFFFGFFIAFEKRTLRNINEYGDNLAYWSSIRIWITDIVGEGGVGAT